MAAAGPTEVMPESGDVHGVSFRYFDWQPLHRSEKPYEILFDVPSTARRCNFSFVPSTVPETVENVRGREAEFQLDLHGFLLRRHRTEFSDWHDREAVRRRYIPELEAYVKTQVEGADRVVAYDWRVGDIRIQTPPGLLTCFLPPSLRLHTPLTLLSGSLVFLCPSAIQYTSTPMLLRVPTF